MLLPFRHEQNCQRTKRHGFWMEGKFGSVMVALQIYSRFLQKQRYVEIMKLFLATNGKLYLLYYCHFKDYWTIFMHELQRLNKMAQCFIFRFISLLGWSELLDPLICCEVVLCHLWLWTKQVTLTVESKGPTDIAITKLAFPHDSEFHPLPFISTCIHKLPVLCFNLLSLRDSVSWS